MFKKKIWKRFDIFVSVKATCNLISPKCLVVLAKHGGRRRGVKFLDKFYQSLLYYVWFLLESDIYCGDNHGYIIYMYVCILYVCMYICTYIYV